MAFRDIALTNLDGDLLIKNGDLSFIDSDAQHIHDIINDAPGEWKQYPVLGCNISNYQYSPVSSASIEQKIQSQLTADGYVASPVVKYLPGQDKLNIVTNAYRPL